MERQPRDSFKLIGLDLITTGLYSTAVLAATKPLRGITPEPFDLGYHTGNTGMTMVAISLPLAYQRILQMYKGKSIEYLKYKKRAILLASVFSLAINLAAEYTNDIYRQGMNTTSDPIDIGYGMGGGILGAHLMTRRLKDYKVEVAKKNNDRIQKSPKKKYAEKSRKNMQRLSRRRNRQSTKK